jgi:hypothetical protein
MTFWPFVKYGLLHFFFFGMFIQNFHSLERINKLSSCFAWDLRPKIKWLMIVHFFACVYWSGHRGITSVPVAAAISTVMFLLSCGVFRESAIIHAYIKKHKEDVPLLHHGTSMVGVVLIGTFVLGIIALFCNHGVFWLLLTSGWEKAASIGILDILAAIFSGEILGIVCASWYHRRTMGSEEKKKMLKQLNEAYMSIIGEGANYES